MAFRDRMWFTVVVFGLFSIFSALARGQHHNDRSPGLKFCDANPVVRKLDKEKILEMERNEWRTWDQTVLKRTMQMARGFGKGSDYYVANTWVDKDVNGWPNSQCNNSIRGVAETTEFIFYPTSLVLPCPKVKMLGKGTAGDLGKLICEPDAQLNMKGCVVYSLGSNNQFQFEESVSAKYSKCKIYTFDCTSNPPKSPIHNVRFEKSCLGARDEVIDGRQYHTIQKLMEKHDNNVISLFKMDIEGYEMEVFDAILAPPYSPNLPFQLSFETHYWHMSAVSALFHVALFDQLTLAGYRPIAKAHNKNCVSCIEHTFLRVFC